MLEHLGNIKSTASCGVDIVFEPAQMLKGQGKLNQTTRWPLMWRVLDRILLTFKYSLFSVVS